MKVSFRGGVHPAHHSKNPTRSLPVKDFVSDTVRIITGMHIGAPSATCVKKGDHVLMGQVIAEPVGALGIPVHASVSGEVISVEKITYIGAQPVECITIQNDYNDTWVELKPLGNVETVDPSLIVPAVKNAGICGMGGASFPTHIKLSPREGLVCNTIIANGAECETHLTADHRLMLENSVRIVDGLRAAMRAVGAKEGIIGIEDNKPDAIKAMEEACRGRENVRVQAMRTKYPQGGEKQLIEAITGKQVPTGKLPIDAGVIVLNVGTCAAIADAIIDGKPLVERITTITGAVRKPSNLRLRIGTITQDAIGECEGYDGTPGKICFGGAMTGLPLPNDDLPMAKSTNGIVVYTPKEAAADMESACIRCGKCVGVCPIGLNPFEIKLAADRDDVDKAQKLNVMDCVLCGCCSFVCPARRWLTASFKIAKQKVAAKAKGGAK